MSGFPRSVRDTVAVRAGGRCERCGLPSNGYQFHHRRPRGMGGSRASTTNVASNCLMLCPPCHGAVESKRELALEFGYLVPQRAIPERVPVRLAQGWVFLVDDGSVTAVTTHE